MTFEISKMNDFFLLRKFQQNLDVQKIIWHNTINKIKLVTLQTKINNIEHKRVMSLFRKLFGRKINSTPKKPKGGDSPTNSFIKKLAFYGLVAFTTATIISKKFNTNLIFTFEPNQQNLNRISEIPIFHQGIYEPVYFMFLGPIQRIYAKYFEEAPYYRDIEQPANRQLYQIHQLQIHDRYSKIPKEKISLMIILTGCQGLTIATKCLLQSMNSSGFKTFCIKIDDFHNLQRLQSTIKYIKSKHTVAVTYGVGFDYGANLLVNYAAKNEKEFNSVASVANPLDLQFSQKNLQHSNFIWKKLLYEDLLNGRIEACKNYKKLFGQSLKIEQQNHSLYQIDKQCYSGSISDYKELKQNLSSLNSVRKLKIPSLFIQSQQDPFAISIEKNQQKLQNSNCIFVQTQRGGYAQWFESLKITRWIARPLTQYFKNIEGR